MFNKKPNPNLPRPKAKTAGRQPEKLFRGFCG